MADTKRQKLIHLHGAGELTDASKLNVGEIAVRHAANAEEATLYITPDQATLIQFPSLPKVNTLVKGASDAAAQALIDAKAYTDEVAGVYASEGVEASGLRKEIAALEVKLQGEVDGVETALEEYKESNDAVVKKIREDFEAADVTINATIEANEKTTAAALTDLDSRLKVAEDILGEGEGSVAEQISAAVEDVRKDFAAEDAAIRGEFAAADDVVRGEFAAADDVVRGEFAAADNVVRGEFATAIAEANKTLKEELEAYADQAETDAIAAAKTYTDQVAGAYTAEGVEASGLRKEIEERVAAAGTAAANALDAHAKNAEIHVTKELQDKWDATTTRVNTFLDSEAIEGTIDTLHEIQQWMETDGKDASDILEAIADEAKLRESGDTATLNSAKAYTDEVAGVYASEGVEASGLRAEIAQASASAAQALVDANAYTDTRESEVRKDFASADATTLTNAKAYTDEVAGAYTAEGVEASGLRKEIEERVAAANAATAQALTDAKAYTDTEVKKVADVALTSVTVSGADTIVVTPGINTVDLDFANLTIDCGEY